MPKQDKVKELRDCIDIYSSNVQALVKDSDCSGDTKRLIDGVLHQNFHVLDTLMEAIIDIIE